MAEIKAENRFSAVAERPGIGAIIGPATTKGDPI